MRIGIEAFNNLKNKAMRVQPESRTEHDNVILDLRDTKEAVKILRDRLDASQAEIRALKALSDSQAEALNLMKQGRL